MNRKPSISLLIGAIFFAAIVVFKMVADRFTIVRSGSLTRLSRKY
jgi:hypothetical protein